MPPLHHVWSTLFHGHGYNHRLVDPVLGVEYENLGLI